MTEKILLILAGLSGKSTLLVNALKKKIPIFGAEFDGVFQGTAPQEGDFEDVLKINGIFSEIHIGQLLRLDSLPRKMTMHVDLLSVCSMKFRAPSVPNDLRSSTADWLADKVHNQTIFKYLVRGAFFKCYDRIVINTLYVPHKKYGAMDNQNQQ
jgi:hypothetical protein